MFMNCITRSNSSGTEYSVKDDTEILHQAMKSMQNKLYPVHSLNHPWPTNGVECNVCRKKPLQQKVHLLNPAETAHGSIIVQSHVQKTVSS
ncbi:hypothetical protein EMCG_03395 [[Emmonsia] crescens]|uniref:Uncharacterized protein n=1 Tax=[Emmonsia] crescens TaxID=73230 RepID=A0A0G2J8E7_9EURO|nr:hypothetical protein EMCG_03395 [Emmonsia crescens UAMH 3008]